MLFAVQRSRLCLDYGTTMAGMHVLVTSAFSAGSRAPFPGTLSWWVVWLACLSITVSGSEYLCRIKELAPIPIKEGSGRSGRRTSSRKSKGGKGNSARPRDEGEGAEAGEALELLPLPRSELGNLAEAGPSSKP
jgi:hypothetical protein